MADTDQTREDEVLRRMLNTQHEKHKLLKARRKRSEVKDAHDRYSNAGET